MRPAVEVTGHEYYEYVLLSTEDALVVNYRAEHVLHREIGKYVLLEDESTGPPDIYLGGMIRQVDLSNGATAWTYGSPQYVWLRLLMLKSTWLRRRASRCTVKSRLLSTTTTILHWILPQSRIQGRQRTVSPCWDSTLDR